MDFSVTLGDPTPFLDRLFSALTDIGINVEPYELDHICYRVAEEARYNSLKQALLEMGELISEKEIGGRLIAVMRLHTPFNYHDRQIQYVELPQPKLDAPYTEGYEHVEFVIDGSLNSFITLYPNINFDRKGLRKSINADLRLKFDGFSVKFHEQPLDYVINNLD